MIYKANPQNLTDNYFLMVLKTYIQISLNTIYLSIKCSEQPKLNKLKIIIKDYLVSWFIDVVTLSFAKKRASVSSTFLIRVSLTE